MPSGYTAGIVTFVTVVPVLTGVTIEPNPLEVPPEFALNASAIVHFNDGGQFSVNGQRASSNYWMVDGASANIGTSSTIPPGKSCAYK